MTLLPFDIHRTYLDFLTSGKVRRPSNVIEDNFTEEYVGFKNILSQKSVQVYRGRKSYHYYYDGVHKHSTEKLSAALINDLLEKLNSDMDLPGAIDKFFCTVESHFKSKRSSKDSLFVRLPNKDIYLALVVDDYFQVKTFILPKVEDEFLANPTGRFMLTPDLRDDPSQLIRAFKDLDS